LNPGAKSDMGESTAVHSVEVSVSARTTEPIVAGGNVVGARGTAHTAVAPAADQEVDFGIGTGARLRESRP
jgi:hypothetical protein